MNAWRAAAWRVERRPFTLYEAEGRLDHSGFSHAVYPRLDGANLVAVREGKSPECLVVGAHFDTVRDSPGACDNGAAVAVLADLARRMGSTPSHLTVVLMAFDFEEVGLLGARHAVVELLAERPVSAAIVLEAVGWYDARPGTQQVARGFGLLFPRTVWRLRRRGMRADWTAVVHRSSARGVARQLADELRAVAGRPEAVVELLDPLDVPVLGTVLRRFAPSLRHLSRSDHVAFWEKDIPAVQVTDTANFRSEAYHQPTDTADRIDFNHLARVSTAVGTTVHRLAAAGSIGGHHPVG